MPEPTTTRLGLPSPAETDPADVPTDLNALRKRLDLITAMYLQGAASTRPTAGTPGRLFFATDERRLYYDDGQLWNATGIAPPGAVIAAATSAAQAGWLVCDGLTYPRAEYSVLFSVIGTAWGAGDGSSTFNVPDLRGRAPIGAGTGAGLTSRSVGQRAGEETHQLKAAESGMPDHVHGLGPGVIGIRSAAGGGAGLVPAGSEGAGFTQTGEPFPSSTQNAEQAHNNMQPFAVVNYLIKT